MFLEAVHSAVQTFPFGPKGSASLAAKLWEAGGHAAAQGKSIDPDTPYAEFWQGGTHEKGPSTLAKDGRPLSQVLRERKHELLGDRLLKKMPWVDSDTHGGVPVLFKILSAGKALPLQAHPDAEMSKKLYESQPEREDEQQVRFDGVHKPEIALALTDFRGLIGFAPREDIMQRFKLLPELQELLLAKNIPIEISKHLHHDMVDPYNEIVEPGHTSYSWHDKVSAALGRMLGADDKLLLKTINLILKRAFEATEEAWPGPEAQQLKSLILELDEQYPGDSGVLVAPVFMNLAELKPGECIYAPADTIHAWLSGNIIEAMPASVNVHNVAFGPEPSLETLDLFTKMLTYEFKPVSDFKIEAEPLPNKKDAVFVYRIPLEEFDVLHVKLDAEKGPIRLFDGEEDSALDGIAIIGVVSGQGKMRGFNADSKGGKTGQDDDMLEVKAGSVVVVGKGTGLEISGDGPLDAYISVCQPKNP
ncbi:Mannose-6-phosphate isomerase [Tilletia horrida]|nr:Mannose-6-phosphate isomerase [Tilletia horrida]